MFSGWNAHNLNFGVKGNIVDIENKRIFKGEITVENGKISSVKESNHAVENYILPKVTMKSLSAYIVFEIHALF